MKKCEYRIVENYEGNCRIVGKEKVFERAVARIKKLGEDFFWKWVESADENPEVYRGDQDSIQYFILNERAKYICQLDLSCSLDDDLDTIFRNDELWFCGRIDEEDTDRTYSLETKKLIKEEKN